MYYLVYTKQTDNEDLLDIKPKMIIEPINCLEDLHERIDELIGDPPFLHRSDYAIFQGTCLKEFEKEI